MRYIVKQPVKAVKIAKTLIIDWNKEHFIGLYLNPRLRVEKAELISLGCLNASLVHPRETFKPALINSTIRVIVLHNHPSGDVEPSEDDLTITKRLVEAGKILGIDLYDHIVFTKKKWLSMKEKKDNLARGIVKTMGYIQDLEKELREKLSQMDKEKLIKFFKDKVWESYKNGTQAGKRPRKQTREELKESNFSPGF
tara:strand:+ start:147 stop:737 length:591 start_codon:yes stop_codon:yes gene_type:complete